MNSNSRPQSRTNKYLQNSTISSRSYDSMNLDKFPDLMSLSQYSTLTFCHNPITSFLSLPILPDLVTLKLDYTKISSFNGAKKQPQLSTISMTSTPISSYKYFVEMCLIAFGTQLLRINDKMVSPKQRKFAKENDNILNKYISTGWLITKGSQPIHLLHYQTRKRICFYTTDKKPNRAYKDVDSLNDNESPSISISIPKNEQESESTTYGTSFVSDSSEISSNTASVNNSSYNLDEKTRDSLLEKMIQLSREWNPPQKTRSYDKDDFLESSIFELFRPSMARNRRLVIRDQRPENLFRLPVSVQSESPYADQKKPYLLRKREEYELRIKQKQEQLRRQQEEEEIEYEEEEEEEEIVEQERIKDENQIQLQDNLQEEKIKDNIITNDANNLNDNEVKENNTDINEKPILKEESIQTDEKDNDKEPIILSNKPEIKQIKTKRKSMTTITTPKMTERKLQTVKTQNNLIPPQQKEVGDESTNSPLLTDSEMEVFRKRRLMSMNKFILNPNSAKQNTENTDTGCSPIDDNITKKRRKTLTHAKTIKYIETPKKELDSNNESSGNLTDSNNNFTPKNSNRDKFTRRPTYSEINSSRYKQQRKLSFSISEQNNSSLKTNQSSQSANKFNLTQRKTSFASLDINKILEENAKAKTETDSSKKETETQSDNDHQNNIQTETKKYVDTANNIEIETETNPINNFETETKKYVDAANNVETETKIDTNNNVATENETDNIKETENEKVKDDENEIINDNIEKQEKDQEDDLMDNEINHFLQKQKSEEEEAKSQNKNDNIEEDEEPDLQMLDEMLKDVDDGDEGDLDEKETELRLAAFQECIEKHPDKEADDDFVNEYVEQYLKKHLKK